MGTGEKMDEIRLKYHGSQVDFFFESFQAGTLQLPEIWLPLGSGLGNLVPSGSVKVRAEWRPLASRQLSGSCVDND